jgi:hypothetical protein
MAFDVEKKLFKSYYFGISLGFENYNLTDKIPGGIYTTSPVLFDRSGGTVIYLDYLKSLTLEIRIIIQPKVFLAASVINMLLIFMVEAILQEARSK